MHFNNCYRPMAFKESHCTLFSAINFLILFMTGFCLKLLSNALYLQINAAVLFNMHCTFIYFVCIDEFS